MKYGLNNENLKFWVDFEDDEIKCVVLKYYSGMHVFSKNGDCDFDEVAKLIGDEEPSVVCAEKYLIEELSGRVSDYKAEYGWIRVLSKHYDCEDSIAERASPDDLADIVNLILDDHMGEFHEFDELIAQFREREDDDFGRSYVIKDGDRISSSASTTAEVDGVAVLSYVITVPEYRGKGLATKVCAKLCNDMIDDGKKVYLVNYTEESVRLYDKLGFEVSCEIGKLY